MARYLNIEFSLGNFLFGAAKLIKNADPNKNGYSGYEIRFDAHSQFSCTDGSWGKNVVLFLELIIVLLCKLIIKTKIS